MSACIAIKNGKYKTAPVTWRIGNEVHLPCLNSSYFDALFFSFKLLIPDNIGKRQKTNNDYKSGGGGIMETIIKSQLSNLLSFSYLIFKQYIWYLEEQFRSYLQHKHSETR